MLATGLVYAALPSSLSVGPDWLLLVVMGALVVASAILHRVGYRRGRQNDWVRGQCHFDHRHDLLLGLLVAAIPKHEIDPKILLRSAVRYG